MSMAGYAAPKLTIYDDGLSCPNNCDAHVVFHQTLNGTKFAHSPNSTSAMPQRCAPNTDCRICFDDKAKECLITPYRGGGPSKNTFDLTPAFYSLWCGNPDIPTRLRSQCDILIKQSQTLVGRINCIAEPEHDKCQVMMRKAVKDKQQDSVIYQQCLEEGEEVFNLSRPEREKRIYGCAYRGF